MLVATLNMLLLRTRCYVVAIDLERTWATVELANAKLQWLRRAAELTPASAPRSTSGFALGDSCKSGGGTRGARARLAGWAASNRGFLRQGRDLR
jgi:hypothetical protein